MTQEQIELMQKSAEMVRSLTASLNKATQTITEQADLIKHLSEDNLRLVAKLDELTGKTAPGTKFSA
jgi:hypothetical protein